MRNRRNHYRILHVQPDAPPAVLKSSYRALMLSMEMHPDRGGEHWNAAAITEAYAVLSDPAARKAYDRTLDVPHPAGRRDGSAAADGSAKQRVQRDRERAGDCCLFCGSTRRVDGALPDAALCSECRSPLTLAGSPGLAASGRRAARRVSVEGAIRYFTTWPQTTGHEGKILDLSPGGLKFLAPSSLAMFRILKIQGPLLDAVVRIVSCRSEGDRFTVGSQFYTVRFHSHRGTFLSVRA